MDNLTGSSALVFRRTERVTRIFLYAGGFGAIVLVSAFVLGVSHVIAPIFAVVMFGLGGCLLMFLALYWRGRSRIRNLRRAMKANQTDAIPGMVEQMRKSDPRWLALGGLVGLAVAAATIAFALLLLR
jgi:uncharacterized membrane protein